jgi:hypothetical protein
MAARLATARPTGAAVGLAIALSLLEAAEAATLKLPVSGLEDSASRAELAVKRRPAREEVPPWLDWALKLANGSLFSLPQPTWEGPLPLRSSRWRLELDLGYKARPDLGVGPTVALLGRLRWLSWAAEGHFSLLGAKEGLGASSELVLSAAPMQLRLRTWISPGASLPGQSVTLKLTQRF